jgi:phosphopantothenoylcysteine decarboxylase/phosphopantothenate--cysteine ligase
MFKHIVICSGPTWEPIDPVRFIANRSSGKSGLHLVNEAVERGFSGIIFITGPTNYDVANPLYSAIRVETALQMREYLLRFSRGAEVIIMAAAVSDYRVASYSKEKIKKDQDTLTLQLVKNPDLLYELGQRKEPGQILVGYAAETHDIFKNARKKFERKNLDLLVLNQICDDNPAFNVNSNQVYFLTAAGGFRRLEMMEKSTLGARVWDEIIKLRGKK